jgi:type VI secretion system protein ImpK
MSDQVPRAPVEDEGEPTVFRPQPVTEDKTVIAGLVGPRPADPRAAPAPFEDERTVLDELTLVRPGPNLRRPGSAAPAPRSEPADAPPPRRSAVQSSGLEATNENPFLRAAAPLLLLLGRLRTSLLRATDASLVPQIAAGIEACERELQACEIAPEDVRTAKFVLCVTADEVLTNLPRGDHDVTNRTGLLTRFFGVSDGGRQFLDELDRAREDPKAHFYLVELFHACLTLCFQGGHASPLGGTATLQDLRQDLYERLQQVRAARGVPLSPRWQGQPLPGQAAHVRVPFWAVASFVGLALFATYVGLRLSLVGRAEALAAVLVGVEQPAEIAIREETVPPPPQPPQTAAQASQLEHIRKVLAPSIGSGALAVRATPNQIVLEIAEKALFQPSKATLLDDARPLVLQIAYALDDEKGPVKVVGHSDPTPVVGARFSSSFELSQDRARSVAAVLARSLSDPSRVTAQGMGADAPIAANDTEEGRSKNRRIDIVLPRRD